MVKYDLIKYEDPQEGSVPVFFWINEEGIRISPYMSSESECKYWMHMFDQKAEQYRLEKTC